MATDEGPKGPARPTIKRLFAVSGNRCAFPKCSTPLVDVQSGSIVGEVCHIKGEKPGAARYDEHQHGEERQAFENLLLLCNVHHKIVDDDDVAYTVERLIQMKKAQEVGHQGPSPVDDSTAEHFVTVAINSSEVHGSVVISHGQTGGQTAHVIHNYHGVSAADEPVRLDAKLDVASGLEFLQTIGCPGMQFTVICRSVRQAKIKSAHLCIEGGDYIKGFQVGFATDFGYTPVDGAVQTLDIELLPLSPANAAEGFVLSWDDVCRFFYPLPFPPTMLILGTKPEKVSMTVKFFDDTSQTLLRGREVLDVLESLYEIYKERPGKLRSTVTMSVRTTSKTKPKVDMEGKVNQHAVPMDAPDATSPI